MSDEKRLEELADLVSEFRRIDPDDPRVTTGGDDASRSTAENLRVLGAIAAFGREAWDREAGGDPAAWGPLEDLERIGEDDRGSLHRARHGEATVLLRLVADPRKDPSQARLRLVAEAERLRDHPVPGVRRVLGVERHEDRTGIWWEAGEAGPLDPDNARAAIAATAHALSGLHALGLVHRRVADDRLVRVGDTILFHDEPAPRSAERGPGTGGGADPEEPPEIRRGAPPGPRSDVYALGRLARDLLSRDGDPAPAVVRELGRALDPEPDRRHADPGSFAAALARAAADPGAPPRSFRLPTPAWVALAAGILAVLLYLLLRG